MRLTWVPFVAAVILGACASETVTTQSGADPLDCETERAEIVSMLQSGLPTYDYDPFPDTASLVVGSDAVVFGVIDSLSRKVHSDDGSTVAMTSAVDVVYPADSDMEITSITWSSWWADRSTPDPLATQQRIEGLEFVAFLTDDPASPTGFSPHVQGLSVGCVDSGEPPTPVQAALPVDAEANDLDGLRELVDELVGEALVGATGPLDGPVMRHPARSETIEGEGAEIFGRLELEGDCLYLAMVDPSQRFPVIWPAGTRWNAAQQVLTTPNGDQIGLTDEAYGGGGYRDLDSVKSLLGHDAHAFAERCLDNEFGEIAVVNNHDDAIGRREG